MAAPVPRPHRASPAVDDGVTRGQGWTWLSTAQPPQRARPAATVILVPTRRSAWLARPPATSSPPIRGSSLSPALDAVRRLATLCRYCGSTNKIPYSATETAMEAAVPQVNRRSRNLRQVDDRVWPNCCSRDDERGQQHRRPGQQRPGGQRGPAPRRAVDEAPDQTGDGRGGTAAHPARPVAGATGLRDSGISTAPATRVTQTAGTLIQNTECHEKCCSSRPPSTGPSGRLERDSRGQYPDGLGPVVIAERGRDHRQGQREHDPGPQPHQRPRGDQLRRPTPTARTTTRPPETARARSAAAACGRYGPRSSRRAP